MCFTIWLGSNNSLMYGVSLEKEMGYFFIKVTNVVISVLVASIPSIRTKV